MPELKQSIHFCRADDGLRLAYSTMGKGPPLIRAAHYLTHLEYDLRNLLWRPWLAELSRHHTLVRYDPRGCGLSDRETSDLPLERWVADLEAVVDAAGFERFVLFGASQSGAIAITYAARHPERVTRLVIYGGFLRGAMRRNPTPGQVRQWQMMLGLVELGWGRDNPVGVGELSPVFFQVPAKAASNCAPSSALIVVRNERHHWPVTAPSSFTETLLVFLKRQ